MAALSTTADATSASVAPGKARIAHVEHCPLCAQFSLRYFVTDTRMQHRIDRQWQAGLGVDNRRNCRYLAFYPYPQRAVHAELRFDY